ncbi:MAG: DUF3560 domain-containing protein, partial [Bdellovibrio sp.]
QPILIGHHSERRHRRHLERIENRVRKGYQAAEEAQRLEQRAKAAETRTAIDSDNPEAQDLLAEKIARLEKTRDKYKKLNALVRKYKTVHELAEAIKKEIPESKDAELLSEKLLKPNFCGQIGVEPWQLTNIGAEIRRLKKRQEELKKVQCGFDPIQVGEITVTLEEGQLRIKFPWKPCEETREKLKRDLVFKWSRFSECWVRKHTATTASQYFIQRLKECLEAAKP